MASESRVALYDDAAALVQQQISVHKQNPLMDHVVEPAIGDIFNRAAVFQKTSTLLLSETALGVVKGNLMKVTSGAAALVAKEGEYTKELQKLKNQSQPQLKGLRKNMTDFLEEKAGDLLVLGGLWPEQAAAMVQLVSLAGLPEVSDQLNTTFQNITNVFETYRDKIRLVSEKGDFLIDPIGDQAKLLLLDFQGRIGGLVELLESSKGLLTESMEPFVDRIKELSTDNPMAVSGWESVPGHVNSTIDNVTAAAKSLTNIVSMVADWDRQRPLDRLV